MRKLARGSKVVVASHNAGKVWEIHQLLTPYGLEAVSAGDIGLLEPEETEPTFAGNALLKARAATLGSGLPALADDSGLEVDMLNGAPGIFSARWAGPGKDFGLAMKRVADEITARDGWTAPAPRANFISVLCLAFSDGTHELFEGKVFGNLTWPPRGGEGFGYDPMFVPDGGTKTFGEMAPAEKYAISHRTRAFAKFKAACLDADAQAGDAAVNAKRDEAGLHAAAANISTREELAALIVNVRSDLEAHGEAWTNTTLAGYLQALQERLKVVPAGSGEPIWRSLAKALLAARRND